MINLFIRLKWAARVLRNNRNKCVWFNRWCYSMSFLILVPPLSLQVFWYVLSSISHSSENKKEDSSAYSEGEDPDTLQELNFQTYVRYDICFLDPKTKDIITSLMGEGHPKNFFSWKRMWTRMGRRKSETTITGNPCFRPLRKNTS